jgi:hypothetical protein
VFVGGRGPISCGKSAAAAAALLGWLAASAFAEAPAAAQEATQGIAGNPGAADVEPGSGALGQLIGFGPESGVSRAFLGMFIRSSENC